MFSTKIVQQRNSCGPAQGNAVGMYRFFEIAPKTSSRYHTRTLEPGRTEPIKLMPNRSMVK